MNESLLKLLTELELFGRTNDDTVTDRSRKMLNITHDTGEFLAVLIRAMHAQRVLEIGTSDGYSTLWLASAVASIGGRVTTIDSSDYKIELAKKNFSRSNLASLIDQIQDDAKQVLSSLENSAFDFIFLDSERVEYPAWWSDIKRALRVGGLLVADNAISHPAEMAPFTALVNADPEFTTCLVPIGNGEFLATRVNEQSLSRT